MFRPDDKAAAEPIHFFQQNGLPYCLLPLTVPVGQPRGPNSRLVLNVSVTPRPKETRTAKADAEKNRIDAKESGDEWCHPEEIDKPNLLSGLRGDSEETSPVFAYRPGTSAFPSTILDVPKDPSKGAREALPVRKVARKSIPVRVPLNVSVRTSSVSATEHILCVVISLNQCDEYQLQGVDIDMPNAVVTECAMEETDFDLFPCLLQSTDETTLLYNFSLLDDAQSLDLQNGNSNECQGVVALPSGMSRNTSITSLTSLVLPREENGRWVTITIRGAPVAKGLEDQVLVSKWNFNLDQGPNGRLVAARGGQDAAELSSKHPMQLSGPGPASQQSPSMYRSRRSSGGFASTVQTRGANLHERPWNGDHRAGSGSGFRSIVQKLSRRRHSLTGGVANPSNARLNTGKAGSAGLARNSLHSVFETRTIAKVTECVVVSFSVSLDITVRKVFSLKVFIVNRSNRTRNLTLMIPNRKLTSTSVSVPDRATTGGGSQEKPTDIKTGRKDRPAHFIMDEAEFLRRYAENEKKEASVVCLENNVRLSPLHPMTCQSINLHFVAIKEHLHTIDLIQLQDNDSGVVVNMTDVLEIYVRGQDDAGGVDVDA